MYVNESLKVVEMVIVVDAEDVFTSLTRDVDLLETSRFHVFPKALTTNTLVDFALGVECPDVLTMVAADGDVQTLADTIPFAVLTIAVVDETLGVVDSPDVFSRASSAVDLLELNVVNVVDLLPLAAFAVAVEDVVKFIDAPDVHAVVSTDRNLLELTINFIPLAVGSITVVESVIRFDAPDLLSHGTTNSHTLEAVVDLLPVVALSLLIVNLIVAVDTPNVVAIVGAADLLETTFHLVPLVVDVGLGSLHCGRLHLRLHRLLGSACSDLEERKS